MKRDSTTAEHIVEWTSPTLLRSEAHMNIAWLLRDRVARTPGQVLIEQKVAGRWHELTGEEFTQHVDAVAAGLVDRGLQVNDAVAIMSPTRYEWTLADFAALSAGLVVIPMYVAEALRCRPVEPSAQNPQTGFQTGIPNFH